MKLLHSLLTADARSLWPWNWGVDAAPTFGQIAGFVGVMVAAIIAAAILCAIIRAFRGGKRK